MVPGEVCMYTVIVVAQQSNEKVRQNRWGPGGMTHVPRRNEG